MEENKTIDQEKKDIEPQIQETPFINIEAIIKTIVLNWYWFVLSFVICFLGASYRLLYVTPTFLSEAQLLIKENENGKNSNSSIRTNTLGIISNSQGVQNEVEILKSRSLAIQVIKDLKIYTYYTLKGRVRDEQLYKNEPISVDMPEAQIDSLNGIVKMQINREDNEFKITGQYQIGFKKGEFVHAIKSLPAKFNTPVGTFMLKKNHPYELKEGKEERIQITSPQIMAEKLYTPNIKVTPNEENQIVSLQMVDAEPRRSSDYIKQLVICYNRQANEDKNMEAILTEKFINERLEKINAELSSTEGQLEAYKKSHSIVNSNMKGNAAFGNSEAYDQRLKENETQLELLSSISDFIRSSKGSHEVIPTNIGLQDASANSLITRYNQVVLERNRLLASASENSPVIIPLTEELNDLRKSIVNSIDHSRKSILIQRNAISSQMGKYQEQISESPEQERMLTQIGRQQEVKSGLYLLLLQKREENAISLAATADKGRLIDEPLMVGQVAPKKHVYYLYALVAAIAIPGLIFFFIGLFKFKIEGHDDVEQLTLLPILADVAVASDSAKTKADIVVHENKNNQMEEIFRSMRTNLQFMMKEGEKVIMFTSTTSGEGKTFNAANLAVSFAILGKKVCVVGLDIRKPRLAELFEIKNHHNGITNLLTLAKPTVEDIQSEMLPSGINKYLDLLLAGPIPPNPAELVARPSLDIIFEHLREMYDYIIIDTAPVGLVTDSLSLGRVADATVYVCRADYTSKSSFELINGLNAEKKLKNMSIVINGIDMSKKKYGYYYGYGRYGKLGHYGSRLRYGRYGGYGKYGGYGYGNYGRYGGYSYGGTYGKYGRYGNYGNKYGVKNDHSIKM